MTFANDFDRIKYYYGKGWASKAQVAQYVQFNVITAAEYELITGETYVA